MREYTKLCDVCDFQGGSQPPKDEWSFDLKAGYIRMLQIRDFTQSERVVPEYIKITKTTKTCEADDILIARYGASLGKILTGLAGAYNVAIMKAIPDTNMLEKKYLYYYLKSPIFQGFLLNVGSRAAQAGFNKNDLQDLLIPNLTRNEQVEIVGILERVETVIEVRQKELQKLDNLLKARFVEMFGDPVRNSMRLPTEPMTTVCAIIDGDRGKNYPKQDEFSDTGYCLFLNAKNVTATGFSFENRMFITKEKDNALHNGKLERGDVVLTTRGTLGNLALYDDSVPFENVRINSSMVILRMNKSVMTEVFFMEQFKLQLQSIKGKIASGSAQPQLPISTMNKIRILLVPMALQNQFADFVQQVDKSKYDDIRVEYKC